MIIALLSGFKLILSIKSQRRLNFIMYNVQFIFFFNLVSEDPRVNTAEEHMY